MCLSPKIHPGLIQMPRTSRRRIGYKSKTLRVRPNSGSQVTSV